MLRAINRIAVTSDMKMHPTVLKGSTIEDVVRDDGKLVFPFAIDITPNKDFTSIGGVKEDEDKLNDSEPIDNKAKDVITLTFLQKWGMTAILAVIGTCSFHLFNNASSNLEKKLPLSNHVCMSNDIAITANHDEQSVVSFSSGCCFMAAYVFLIIYAANQVRSASNSPKSHLGGYSTSDYGWDISSFRNVDFVSQPRALSGRYSTGKNVKTTSL